MKKLIFAGAAALAISLLASAASSKELRLSSAVPPNSPYGQVAQKFIDKVAELSGGELTVTPYMASKLGGEQDVIKQIARGRIDMGLMSNSSVSLVVPEFGLLASPYAFDSAEQFDCVADNHLLDTYDAEFDAAKIKTLSFVEIGYQVIGSKEGGRVPADFADMKIRTAPSVTDTKFFEAFATAVPLSPNDTIPALQTGQIDGASMVSVFGFVTGYPKVTPFFTMTRHQHQVGAVVMSKSTWDGLSEQEQAWVEEAAPIFLELRGILRGAEGALAKKVTDEDGATIIELTSEELAQWKAVVPDAQEAILADMGDAARAKWEAIQSAKAACGG